MKVVGFISYGNFRDETIQAGEIIALYVLKDYYGKGIAQKLMKAALTDLDHFSEIFLWVLKIISAPLLSIKKWALLLMDKKRYLNLESL